MLFISLLLLLETVDVDSRCAKGWTQNENSCYQLSENRMNWTEAKTACEEKDARLAVVKSEEVNAVLDGLFKVEDNETRIFVWLGGFQVSGAAEPAGGWTWVDGTAIEFSKWDQGQPDNRMRNNQNCLQIWKGQGSFLTDGYWDDNGCWTELNYFCEYQEKDTTTTRTTTMTTIMITTMTTTTTNTSIFLPPQQGKKDCNNQLIIVLAITSSIVILSLVLALIFMHKKKKNYKQGQEGISAQPGERP